jgi:dihydroneopterin aldolase
MTDDLSTAFDLHARAAAMGGPLDRISLRDHVVAAEIGAFEVERGVTQRLRFDIVVEVLPLTDAGDDVDRILSYDRLAEAVAAELAAERLALLETLADRIAARILREPQAARVFLRIQKLDRGPGDLGVEVVRARLGEAASPGGEAPRPRLVLLDPLPAASDVPGLVDRLSAAEGPLLLCAGAPGTATPVAQTEAAQRRIDLLALDQSAWALGSCDPRLLVASSRTELDWALRQGRPCVWAPAKVVLDAVDGPAATDGRSVAIWLAGALRATELRLPSAEPAPDLGGPVPLIPGEGV